VAATIAMVLFLLCGVILSLLILIQRGRGGGLAGAFGGAGGSSAFGTKTADVFIKATAVLGGIFFVLAIVTALLMHGGPSTTITAPNTPAPKSPATPGAESGGGATPAPATGGGATPAPATGGGAEK
jgi:preprotein translocase subunit SecG